MIDGIKQAGEEALNHQLLCATFHLCKKKFWKTWMVLSRQDRKLATEVLNSRPPVAVRHIPSLLDFFLKTWIDGTKEKREEAGC